MMIFLIVCGIVMPIVAAFITWQLVIHTLPSAIAQHHERPTRD